MVNQTGDKMTQLQMERAARAAGAQTRAIALYRTNPLNPPGLSPLMLAAAFSSLLWVLFLTRAALFFL